jgi:hypothetical protein
LDEPPELEAPPDEMDPPMVVAWVVPPLALAPPELEAPPVPLDPPEVEAPPVPDEPPWLEMPPEPADPPLPPLPPLPLGPGSLLHGPAPESKKAAMSTGTEG